MTDTMTMTTTFPLESPARPRGVRRVMLESAYNLSAFFIALAAFVLVVVNLTLGLVLTVFVGGVLLLALAVNVARGIARLERFRLRTMLGREAATPVYLCGRPDQGFWRRSLTPLRDPQSWLDAGWSILGLVTGTLAFAVTLTWWVGTVIGLTYWFWQRWIPTNGNDKGLAELLGYGEGRTAESWVNLAVGAAFLLTLPVVVRLAAAVHASLASVLLSSRAELQHEVVRVETGRDAARMAEAASLRRLERDIHDGPQQRLIRLSMDLGRARRQLEQDPERAAATIDEALAQTREKVAELRSLSRGIAPPLLVDRGLAAALDEMLTQSVVPVAAHIDVPHQLAPHVETAVYFVVAEALTNVAKHSRARHAKVVVEGNGYPGMLTVMVSDDGIGGADVHGPGLSGLADRASGVDGRLSVESPSGGPTIIAAELPCG